MIPFTSSGRDDLFSIDESRTFSDFINFDSMTFTMAPGGFTEHENQNLLEPVAQDMEGQRILMHFQSPSNEASCQTFKTMDYAFSRCDCYRSTLRVLLHVNETLLNTSSLTLDVALKLDKEVFNHNQKVLQCNICADTCPNQVLLQAVLMDRTISMLESKFRGGTRRRSSQSVPNQQNGVTRQHDHRSSEFSQISGGSDLPRSEKDIMASAKDCALQVGGYEVTAERNIFIKQLLQMRLMNLLAAIQGLEMTADSIVIQDSNARVARIMLVEMSLKLRKLIGRVELWSM